MTSVLLDVGWTDNEFMFIRVYAEDFIEKFLINCRRELKGAIIAVDFVHGISAVFICAKRIWDVHVATFWALCM